MIQTRKYPSGVLLVLSLILLVGCDLASDSAEDGAIQIQAPPGFAPVPVPSHNPTTTAKVVLGEKLFLDPILSRDETISCSSCHEADNAFADPRPVSVGVEGRLGRRNAPTLINVAYQPLLFWDGGSLSLENQVVAPLEDVNEMDADLAVVLRRLNSNPEYRMLFNRAFADSATVETLTQAIAAFQRTIVGRGSPYDRYLAGDETALSPSAKRGMALFTGSAGCTGCHAGIRFTNDSFRNNGLTFANADSGRARITQDSGDFSRFRVPSLRNVAATAPYMHDGRLATLEDVIAHYVAGGSGARGQDALIQPLLLDASQRADLIEFLRALSDEQVSSGVR